jgi:hypothetical protein
MRKKVVWIISMIIFLVLISGFLLVKPAFNYISGFLSKSEIVNANILIVEGWLPNYALKMASEEFHKQNYQYIVTTGIKSNIKYFGLYINGYLIFYPHAKFSGNNEYKKHSVEVEAYSELNGENRAHFNVYLNDTLAGNFYADKSKRKYMVEWRGSLAKIDSILVQFDNDSWGQFGDRNLFVKDLIIDNQIIIPYGNNSAFVESRLSNKHEILTNFSSNAELARNRLVSMGIDSSRIIATPGERVRINRTLTSAVAFRNWLKTSNLEIKGINIFSMGTHARRTWMTYNKILNEKYQIGIISVPDYVNRSKENKMLKTFRETLGIIYYWLILLPY